MKIILNFSDTIYNCKVIIKDSLGTQNYLVNLSLREEGTVESLEAEVANGNFELTLIPEMVDYKSMLSEMEATSFTEKLAKKALNKMVSFVDKTVLRVGCKYKISGLNENDEVFISTQEYVFGTFDRFDILELLPLEYMFFEAYSKGCREEITDAFPLYRNQTISCAKKLALLPFGISLIFTYPFQVGRIKRLTSAKKVKKTLIKFSRMNEEQRKKILDKKEKFMNY